MMKKHFILLFFAGLLTSSVGVVWIRSPGFMDADYYFANAIQLSRGEGFMEPFLWNFLDEPSGIPHPSHLYWMPLTSMVSAPFVLFLGESFLAAQLPFIVLSALLPILTAWVTFSITAEPKLAFTSGLLAIFPGYYYPFFITTDAFVLYGLIGGLTLGLIAYVSKYSTNRGWFAVGCLVALGHFTRADGILLLLPALLGLVLYQERTWKNGGSLGLGYFVVILPWLVRNFRVSGSFLSPGGLKGLWLLEYDDLFSYPASLLSSSRWLESGLVSILKMRVDAILQNMQSLIAVNGLVFLLPFAIVALWRWRKKVLVRISAVYWFALFISMSVVFPFIGARGAYFHSSTALMPLLWAAAPVGLSISVGWISARRNWVVSQAQQVFRGAMVFGAAALTFGLFYVRVIDRDGTQRGWNVSAETYELLTETFSETFQQGDLVLVNNPPGFHLASDLPAIVIPNGGYEVLMAVADRYDARWVLLEKNHPKDLDSLYADPKDLGWLSFVGKFEGEITGEVLLFEVQGVEDR
jgi:4-amino-4-deoxy-L-arabinose transferase-like glycosyltransferase